MGAIVVWALATGAITGAVWIGTLLVSHLRKQAVQQPILLAQLEDRLQRLEAGEKRLAEVEGFVQLVKGLVLSEALYC